MSLNIGWPEGLYIALMVFNLIGACILDGQPKKGNHSAGVTLVCSVLGFSWLYWGGFFS